MVKMESHEVFVKPSAVQLLLKDSPLGRRRRRSRHTFCRFVTLGVFYSPSKTGSNTEWLLEPDLKGTGP